MLLFTRVFRPALKLPLSPLCRALGIGWLVCSVCQVFPVVQAAQDGGLPNFVVINIDDMGYADIEPFGSVLNRTPHLNRLAKEGLKLTSYYAAPVCSPSRAALMTGCYPKRGLPIPHVLFPESAVGMSQNEVTIAELLKTKGYATACIGKWHLGDQPEFLPTRQGFDLYYGLPYSNDMGPAADGTKSSLGEPLPKVDKANQPPLPLMRNETVLKWVLPHDQQELVVNYTQEAKRFVNEHRKQPFLLYLPHSAVHFPLYPGKAFQGHSTNGLYGDWVEEVDWSVGQVLEELDRLELTDNTVVIFTSDNGGTPRAVNKPLRGFKNSTWEGGIRVPTIVRWPGRIPAGSQCDAITGMFDWLPTIAAMAGAELPAGRTLDGRDISKLLTDPAQAAAVHESFYYFRGLDLEAIRHHHWKLHFRKGEAPKLYDLAADVGEMQDVSRQHPDLVAELTALAAQVDGDLGRSGIGPGCRELGKVANPQPLISDDGTIRAGFSPAHGSNQSSD